MLELTTTATLVAFLIDVDDRRVCIHADDLRAHLHLDDGTTCDVDTITRAAVRAGLVDEPADSIWFDVTDAGYDVIAAAAPEQASEAAA